MFMKTNNWTNIVYDIYDFLYWEPQHIGKIKNPQSSYDTLEKSMKHVKNMEVSLNQILNIFFYFLPNRIFSQLIESVTCSSVWEDAYTLYLWEIEDMIEGIKQSTQPDFFFLWNKQNISIEMKTRSQSSLEQLMKYIYLHIKDCERCGFEKQYTLVFLGKWDFSSLWKEEFTTIEDLQKAFENYEIPDVTKKWEVNLKPYKE